VGIKFSSPDQINTETHPAFYIMDTGSLLGVKHLGCEVKECVAIPVHPICAFRVGHRATFTFPVPILYQYIYIYNDERNIFCKC